MAWSYRPEFMESTTAGVYTGSTIGIRYQIRLLIQDVNTSRQLFQDEEIDWVQTIEANAYAMAAACCEMLVARAGGVKAKRISEFMIQYDVDFYVKRAAFLRAQSRTYEVPYAGGISAADKLAQRADADWVAPSISRGLDDNPLAPQPSTPPVNPINGIN